MYFTLGLLTAGVLALLVTPAIWRRATRLTRQRIESSVPMTLAEIQADKDQLRADFAMTARRLEMTVDRLRDKSTEQIIEINEKRAEIVRLTNERNDQSDTIKGLEERTARLVADLKGTEERLGRANQDVAEREATLAERAATITRLQARLDASQQLTDEQKLELVARSTEIGNLNDRLVDAKAVQETISAERDRLATALAAEQAALAAERRRAENLEASLERIEAERIERLAELERRAAEARELVSELARDRARAEDLAARVAELEAERDTRRNEFERRVAEFEKIADAPPIDDGMAAVADGDNIAKAIAAAEAENTALMARLAKLEADLAGVNAENAELRRMAGADWDIEAENAVLRQRLTSVAADVLRLTDRMANGDSRGAHAGDGGNGHAAEERPRAAPVPLHRPPPAIVSHEEESAEPVEGGKTLAERLRALQHTAARH
jgi:chromosome segregation ATPase